MDLVMMVLLNGVVGMFILYAVIKAAVRQGINTSVIGQHFKERNNYQMKDFRNDLDDQ
ncbi:hypothetical protein [Gracilibacillus massiliensis]|uniref:hypothetical protein n=1 Tax=Gracilibacillus massiliensis TaxID=1564956 RepID=UPI000AEED747|nr:hypothetical protein [Gracilibacillus massiliensis]